MTRAVGGDILKQKKTPRAAGLPTTRVRLSATMEMPSNQGCGKPRRKHAKGVSNGEVYHRIRPLLDIRDGRPCEDDHGEGGRQIDRRDEDQEVRRLAVPRGYRIVDAKRVRRAVVRRLRERLHGVPSLQGASRPRRRLRRHRRQQHRAFGQRQEAQERQQGRIQAPRRDAVPRAHVLGRMDSRSGDGIHEGPREDQAGRHGRRQSGEEPGVRDPAAPRSRLEPEDLNRKHQSYLDQGIRIVGEGNRPRRGRFAGGPRVLHPDRRGEPREGQGPG